jgi:ferredoxin
LEDRLVIHPDECIDCTACVSECPVEAIYAEADLPAEYQADVELNAVESRRLKEAGREAILQARTPLPTAAQRKTELDY